MNRPGLCLPSRVTLPAAPMIASWHLRDALGISKQVLSLWRKHHGFPGYHREGRDCFTPTDAVAHWLCERGLKVVRR